MHEQQLDLFADCPPSADAALPPQPGRRAAVAELADEALIAAIPAATLAESAALAAEAGRRRLGAAVPALESLGRRFAGFGIDRVVPEQAAALRALALIGGGDAARAVVRMIARQVVQGPVLGVALDAAARLRSPLPVAALAPLLRHADPTIRAAACRCVCPSQEVVPLLVSLLADVDWTVASAAACALGQMGRIEGRAVLTRLLRDDPSEDAIESVSSIADDECMVLLGRIARRTPSLAEVALAALESLDHPRAGAIAASIRLRPQA